MRFDKIVQLKLWMANSEKLMHPNPTFATLMSICIPGTGQIYAGDIKDGVNSILLLSGLL